MGVTTTMARNATKTARPGSERFHQCTHALGILGGVERIGQRSDRQA